MDFLREPTFTVFIALVLTFLVAKVLSFFAVSDSTCDVSTAVDEGAVAREVTEERELKVRRRKGEKRVKFVDDVVIRRIDRFEGSENLVVVDDVKESGVRVDQFGDDGLVEDFGVENSEKECPDLGEINALVEGCEKTENLIEKEVGFVNENVRNLGEGELRGDDVAIDESVDDVDDDWEGIERSELEKVFAEAVNYVEYGGKDKGDDRLSKLGIDAQMQLYGLHKVAVEGPCCEPQPMALMVSARGKWYLIFFIDLIVPDRLSVLIFFHDFGLPTGTYV